MLQVCAGSWPEAALSSQPAHFLATWDSTEFLPYSQLGRQTKATIYVITQSHTYNHVTPSSLPYQLEARRGSLPPSRGGKPYKTVNTWRLGFMGPRSDSVCHIAISCQKENDPPSKTSILRLQIKSLTVFLKVWFSTSGLRVIRVLRTNADSWAVSQVGFVRILWGGP